MKPFEIGLALTGTVSAGAYTGGVIDFIIEALEQWELEKTKYRAEYGDEDHSQWNVPWHDVLVKGISGASGGGVTCGLILNSIGKQIDPVRSPTKGTVANNDFYNSWVNMLGIDQLLQTTDLTGKQIKSVFNGDAIPTIADVILKKELFGNKLSRKYIDSHLTALITVTNLRGIPYQVSFSGADKPVLYNRHTDYVQIELAADSKISDNGSYVLPYNTKLAQFDFSYAQLKAACLATCAFPAAFKAQPFVQDPSFYYQRIAARKGNLNPTETDKKNEGLALPMGITNNFMCSDGGVLNTEPFELLHQFMLPPNDNINPQAPKAVLRTIIMVAPLETFPEFKTKYVEHDDLVHILPDDVFAIREEALYSAEEIQKAFDEKIYSRFIIAPVRSESATSETTCLPAITGTSLGTFGAFLSRDFREHDYFLGRRNAQLFLRKHFALPVEETRGNPIFDEVLSSPNIKKFTFYEKGIEYLPIIPLCGTAKEDVYFPTWPQDKLDDEELNRIEDLIEKRVGKLIDVLISDLPIWKIWRLLASCVAKHYEPGIAEKIMCVIKNQLYKSTLASKKCN